LQKISLRPEFHPFTNEKGKTFLPLACFTMSSADKYYFLKVIKDVRVPEGYASNHDSHILMQQIMPIALCHSLPTKVVKLVIDLFAFLLDIYSKTL
jgi:hypothetical protein